MKVGLTIGRFQFIHRGHVEYLVNMSKTYDKVVIGIGSCFEHGTERNPFLAVHREKMVLAALQAEGVNLDNVITVCIPDFPTFEEWWNAILEISIMFYVTHFVTGNIKDIIEPLTDELIPENFEFVNPELSSSYQVHASNIRKEVKEGRIEQALDMLHPATLLIVESANLIETLQNIYNEKPMSMFAPGRKPLIK